MRVYKSKAYDRQKQFNPEDIPSFLLYVSYIFTLFCNLIKKAEEQVGIERLREEESRNTCQSYYVWKTQRYYVFFFSPPVNNESSSRRKHTYILSKKRLHWIKYRLNILFELTTDTSNNLFSCINRFYLSNFAANYMYTGEGNECHTCIIWRCFLGG